MKNIMISGSDGTGKSTIATELQKHYLKQGFTANKVWLRFNHYFAKLVNIIGRISGKSYYEEYSWGKAGYHDYKGLIGYLYIIAVYFDHILFRLFLRKKHLINNGADILIIDRYILDVMADLIVDTEKNKLVLFLFSPFAKKELKVAKVFILRCDTDIVVSRRNDIKDDKSYESKRKAYAYLAHELTIQVLDTGTQDVEEIIKVITSS